MNQIKVSQTFFDGIKTTVDSINAFFSSNFKTKNFPEEEAYMGTGLEQFMKWFDDLDPVAMGDDAVQLESMDPIDMDDDPDVGDAVTPDDGIVDNTAENSQVITLIQDNFTEFNALINGIYTLKLYTNPSSFENELEIFGKPIGSMDPEEGIQNVLFSIELYIKALHMNEHIEIPDVIKETDVDRMLDHQDIQHEYEIVVGPAEEIQQEAFIQEEALEEIGKSVGNITFSGGHFHISQQLQSSIDNLISGLSACETTDDLLTFFAGEESPSPNDFEILPTILLRVFFNEAKYTKEFDKAKWDKFVEAQEATMGRNPGAARFGRYDLFSTFKIDKDATIKFIEDYLKLNLVQDESVTIDNNTIRTLFNIFDSRIYFNLLFELIPESDVKNMDDEYQSPEGYLRTIRARINNNSNRSNLYKDEDPNETTAAETSALEFASISMKRFGDMSISDMKHCDQWRHILESEIASLDQVMFNAGATNASVEKFVGESFYISEQESGGIPQYMQQRFAVDDGTTKGSVQPMEVPPVTNSIDDLANSINGRLDTDADLDEQLGSGWEQNPQRQEVEGDGKVVYNITNQHYNIRDSFHRTDASQRNIDLSQKPDFSKDKTIIDSSTKTSIKDQSRDESRVNDLSTRTKIGTDLDDIDIPEDTGDNNNNNDSTTIDSEGSQGLTAETALSTGKSLVDVFAFLESDEPPLMGDTVVNQPKTSLSTAVMDHDKDLLAAQQAAKRGVDTAVGVVRKAGKPASRTKQWLTKVMDSIIKRDEDKVKAEIIENPSYRTALYKATRLALKFGLFGVAFTINPYLGVAYGGWEGAKIVDRQRLRKEVQEEFGAELEILDSKIKAAERDDTQASRRAAWQMKRLRSKMQRQAIAAAKGTPGAS